MAAGTGGGGGGGRLLELCRGHHPPGKKCDQKGLQYSGDSFLETSVELCEELKKILSWRI